MTLDPEKNPNVDPRQCSYSHYERAEKLLVAMMAAGQLKLDTVDPKKGTDSGVGQIKTNLDTFFLWRDTVAQQAREYRLNASTSLLDGWHCSGYSLRKGRSPAW